MFRTRIASPLEYTRGNATSIVVLPTCGNLEVDVEKKSRRKFQREAHFDVPGEKSRDHNGAALQGNSSTAVLPAFFFSFSSLHFFLHE
jgi:hypothetical protein